MEMDRTAALLKECLFLHAFSLEELRQLSIHCKTRDFKTGETVCVRGTSGTEFFIVISGRVAIEIPRFSSSPTSDFSVDDASEGVVVRMVEAGEFFGEIACLEEGGKRTASARAMGECQLLVVPKAEFLQIAQSNAAAAMSLVRHLAQRVRHYTDSLARNQPPTAQNAPDDKPTWWERLAETATAVSVHWLFTVVNLAVWAAWFFCNFCQMWKDMPTVSGLSMFVGLQAILMTTLILAAEKRSEKRSQRREEDQLQWVFHSNESINQLSGRIARIERQIAHSSTSGG